LPVSTLSPALPITALPSRDDRAVAASTTWLTGS
jgi:hypothetical protein